LAPRITAGRLALFTAPPQRLFFEAMSDSAGDPSPPPVSCSATFAELYAADRREHADVPPVGTPEYLALRERDRRRRERAADLLDSLEASGDTSAEDLYHAAWLFNHGDQPAEARRAHELARTAAERGHRPARWLAAAAYDRSCMYEGRPQRYGTQFVPDGVRHRLWDVEPATTDDERAAWDVPPLAEQLRRADELTRTEPQPPMDEAPGWLRTATERWGSEGGEEP
jgi:TPR repeat protein